MSDVTVSSADRTPTRTALVEAALRLFGRKGYDAASTREIAAEAGANIAAIAYHFGGKEGLRRACVEAIGDRLSAIVGPPLPAPVGRAEARVLLERVVRAAATSLSTAAPARDMVAFLLREVSEDGPELDRIFATVVEPRHRHLCALWGAATGTPPESEATRLAVFAMVGQVLYFRIGQPVVLRRMGWQAVSPDAAGRIGDLLVRNLHAALTASERTTP